MAKCRHWSDCSSRTCVWKLIIITVHYINHCAMVASKLWSESVPITDACGLHHLAIWLPFIIVPIFTNCYHLDCYHLVTIAPIDTMYVETPVKNFSIDRNANYPTLRLSAVSQHCMTQTFSWKPTALPKYTVKVFSEKTDVVPPTTQTILWQF